MNRLFITAALVLTLGVLGCGGEDAPEAEAQAGGPVVATTPLLGDIVATLLDGVDADVETLMPAGEDPGEFTADNAAEKLQGARLVVFNGLNLEAALAPTLQSLDNAVAAAELVPAEMRLAGDAFGGDYDPHVYMDVGLFAEHSVVGIADRLKQAFPEAADRIDANLAPLLADLAKLDGYAEAAMQRVPEGQRVLTTARDGFAYFGNAYGLDIRPADGAEESVKDEIYDSLPSVGNAFEGTYLGMMDHNVSIIAAGLGAPGIDLHGTFGRLTLGHDHDH